MYTATFQAHETTFTSTFNTQAHELHRFHILKIDVFIVHGRKTSCCIIASLRLSCAISVFIHALIRRTKIANAGENFPH